MIEFLFAGVGALSLAGALCILLITFEEAYDWWKYRR